MIWQLKLTQLNVKTTTKKPSTKRRSKLPQVVPWHKLTQEMPLTSSNRGGVFFEVTKVDNGILLDWNSQVLLYKSNWGLGLGNAIGWSPLAEQTRSIHGTNTCQKLCASAYVRREVWAAAGKMNSLSRWLSETALSFQLFTPAAAN